jgi:signal peptidase I
MKHWVGILGAATLIFAAGNLFQPTVVVGESMAPTLRSGRVIWIDRTYYKKHKPRQGEVVVFRQDGEVYVKRVYRGPGERLAYVVSGAEWVSPVRETSIEEMRRRCARNRNMHICEMTVPEDSVFVLGDNYLASIDSRQLGPISISDIIGRAHLETDMTRLTRFEYAPRARAGSRGGPASGWTPALHDGAPAHPQPADEESVSSGRRGRLASARSASARARLN